MRPIASLSLCALLGSLSCATEPVSAEEHRVRASDEEAQAAEHQARYHENLVAVRTSVDRTGSVATEEYNPTESERVAAKGHERAAERHRAAARALEKSEDVACVGVPKSARAACPLLLPVEISDVTRGVRVTFASEDEATRAAAVVRCQQAFAATQGFEDLPVCALYAPGLQVEREGRSLELVARDDEHAALLRANVRGHHPAP